MEEIKKGDIIEGKYWNEPVEVTDVEDFKERIRILGRGIKSNFAVDSIINKSDLERINKISNIWDFLGDPEFVKLNLQAIRFKYADLFEPFLAVNVSKIEPLPFQLDAVYRNILKQPRIRFLIADDPGAGKTIMAGLVIKELKLRRIINRILIVVPGHLMDQWRREMKEKFDETFEVIDRSIFDSTYGDNPFNRKNQVITSIDFAKQDEILSALRYSTWDLIIVDEAHKMAAYRYNDKTKKTKRYRLGEVLSKISPHLLFLSATPHKGDPENFRLFLDLLRPGYFSSKEILEESLRNNDNPLFVRRLKEHLRDFNNKPIFTNRYSITVKFPLSDKEKELYNELVRYVREEYNKQKVNDNKRNVGFALLVLQRRMASSAYALYRSLERRKRRLEELLNDGDIQEKPSLDIESIEEIDDMEEENRWEEEKKWETLTFSRTKEELREEIRIVEKLMNMAKEIYERGEEVKLSELKKAIEEGFNKIKETGGPEKILIFTEAKDTLEYLVKKISEWGYKVNFIHGGMKLEDRIEQEKIFRNETQIMIATEAAGEGINLQFCNIMINYDIPWTPIRLEQRMGRIHRFGQNRDVYIFNMVAEGTIEGRILGKLLDKLEEIKSKLGSDRVYDVIGDIFAGKNLYQLVIDAVVKIKSIDDIYKEIEIIGNDEELKRIKEEVLAESLAVRNIDFTAIKEMTELAEEQRLVPEYVEGFFKHAFEKVGGKLSIKKEGILSVDSVPYELRRFNNDDNFKNAYGTISTSYSKITFDKKIASRENAEFVSFGHPLFEAVLSWVMKQGEKELRKGATFLDPDGRYNGIIYFVEGEVRDAKGIAGKRIFALYDDGREIREVNPKIVWELTPFEKVDENINFDEKKIINFSLNLIEKYKEELLEERERQAEIKRKYGLKSLNDLITELDNEIIEYEDRKAKGEKVDIVISNKEEQKKKYQEARKNLEKEIEQETSLSYTKPRILTVIRVISGKSKDEMVSDEEIERIGMKVAMDFERKEGRIPEDVSKENLGYDIKSRGENEVRYIEVKARVDEGSVALTPNEWYMAKRFGDKYYLYVVVNCGKSPELYIIKNPSATIKPEEKIEVVRYIVSPEEWKEKGIRINN